MKFTSPSYGVAPRAALFASVAALGLAMPSAAMAQDADDDGVEESDGAFDDDAIIVTASKRETTLQETPISVSVTSAETIDRAEIRDLADLQTVAPSLRVNTLQSSANTNFVIRGFGNGANNAGIEPSVGVFIDGVYRSRSAAQIGDLANVQRIEVLRGPQSTLFGKNASAGVISVVTREPQFDFGGSVSASYGNFNNVVVKADVTGPISDTIAVSLDGNYNTRDGYVSVPNLGIDINERNRWAVRGQALFEPSSGFKLRLIGDYSKIDEVCCYAGNIVAGPTVPALFGVGGQLVVEDLFSDTTFLNTAPVNVIDNYGVSGQIDYQAGPIAITSITAYRELRSEAEQDVDFSSADIVSSNTDVDIDTFSQELRFASDFEGPFNFLLGGYYFNEKIRQNSGLTTGTAARTFFELLTPTGPGTFLGVEAGLGLPANSIFTPGPLSGGFYTLDNEAYSVFGTVDFAVTDRLTLTAGFNYTDDSKDFSLVSTAFDPLANINLVDAFIIGATGGTVTSRAAFQALPAANQQALLAAATNPAVNPLIGLSAFQFQPPFLNIPNAVEPGQTRDDDWSYTLRASYEINDNLNVYATYATGFKASSVNLSRDSRPTTADYTPGVGLSTFAAPDSPVINAGIATTNLNTGTRFAAPEEAEVYEIGLKGQFPGFGFNLAVFDQTLKGFQSNIFTGTGFALANAGEQSTQGFEFDATISPADPLVFTFAMTYLDPVFDSFPNSAVGNLTGQRPAGIPSISLATSATYTHEFGASGNLLIGRIDYNHESNVNLTNGLPTFGPQAETLFRSEVNLVNGSLTFAMENGFELSVWGRNILDERRITTVFDGVAQAGTVSGYPNQPRTYGATARFKF